MAINILAFMALVAGFYLLYQADKRKKSPRAIYALAGIMTVLWSFWLLFSTRVAGITVMPLLFGLTCIGGVKSKGSSKWLYAGIAALIFLSVALR